MTESIVEFLHARIADEAAAERLRRPNAGDPWGWQPHDHKLETCTKSRVDYTPARVLAECEAKRQLIADHDYFYQRPGGNNVVFDPDVAAENGYGGPCQVLRHLAVIYATHPDFDEEWCPVPA